MPISSTERDELTKAWLAFGQKIVSMAGKDEDGKRFSRGELRELLREGGLLSFKTLLDVFDTEG